MAKIRMDNFRLTKAEKEMYNLVRKGTLEGRERESKTVALFNINYGNCITILDARLVVGDKGLFVSMPSVKKDDVWQDIAYFKTKEAQHEITKIAKDRYSEVSQDMISTIDNLKVIVTPLTGREDKLLGLATITLEDLVVRNVKIMNSDKGVFVAFPQQRRGDEWKSVVFPNNAFMQGRLSDAVLDSYQRSIEKNHTTPNKNEKRDLKPKALGGTR